MTRKHLTDSGLVWYALMNIVTLGAPYFFKLIIMKAIIDSHHNPED